jgi:ABC-type protease/lipase transport system fused ATPase/permease subunit
MRWLLGERLRPFAQVAFGVSAVIHLALVVAALCALRLLDHPPLVGAVVLLGALLIYTADRVRGDALTSAGGIVDRDLVPAAIVDSLDALRDIKLLRTFLGGPGMLALLDAPWLLIYLIAIAWIQPLLGLAALVGVALLIFCVAMTAEPGRAAAASRHWRDSCSACSVHKAARCASTAPISHVGIARPLDNASATSRRKSICSRARLPTTSHAWVCSTPRASCKQHASRMRTR